MTEDTERTRIMHKFDIKHSYENHVEGRKVHGAVESHKLEIAQMS